MSDKIESLCQTVDSLAGLVSGLGRDIRNAVSRIEAIEQRQAKLACSESSAVEDYDGGTETQATENEQWLELARMLPEYVYVDEEDSSIVICHPESALEDYCDGVYSPIMRAMLIGLACGQCNGVVWLQDGLWHWECKPDGMKWDWANSRPAAAIAMLKAYREGNQ